MDEEQFQKEILAAPENDGPRGVYADWLQEQGDPRGEFIHVQLQLAQLPPWHEDRMRLEIRESQLLQAHRAEWEAHVHNIFEGSCFKCKCTFRRGFIESVQIEIDYIEIPDAGQISMESLFSGLAKLKALEPLRRLSFSGTFDDWIQEFIDPETFPPLHETITALLAAPWMAEIRALDLSDNPLTSEILNALAHAPSCGNLTSLALNDIDLSFAPTDDLQAENPDNGQRQAPAVNGMAILAADDSVLKKLEHLSLRECYLGVPGMRALAESATMQNLKSLVLSEDTGIAELGKASFRLQRLTLKDCPRQWADFEALTRLPVCKELETLSIEGHREATEAPATDTIRAIAENLHKLRVLALKRGHLNDACVALLTAPGTVITEVRCLDLSGNSKITDAGVEALAESELSELRILNLRTHGLTTNATKTLIRSERFAKLLELQLAGDFWRDAFKYLADKDSKMRSLQQLNSSFSEGLAEEIIHEAVLAIAAPESPLRNLLGLNLYISSAKLPNALEAITGALAGMPNLALIGLFNSGSREFHSEVLFCIDKIRQAQIKGKSDLERPFFENLAGFYNYENLLTPLNEFMDLQQIRIPSVEKVQAAIRERKRSQATQSQAGKSGAGLADIAGNGRNPPETGRQG